MEMSKIMRVLMDNGYELIPDKADFLVNVYHNKVEEYELDVIRVYKNGKPAKTIYKDGPGNYIFLDRSDPELTKYQQVIDVYNKLTTDEIFNEIPAEVTKRFYDDSFIENVCLSYRHDYGLMDPEQRKLIRFECMEFMRAMINNWNTYNRNNK